MHNSCLTKRKNCETGFKKNITIFRRNSTSKLCETEAANCLNHYLNCLWCLYQGITVQAPLGVGKVHFSDLKWTRVRSYLAQLKWKQTKHKSNRICSVDHEHQDAFFFSSKKIAAIDRFCRWHIPCSLETKYYHHPMSALRFRPLYFYPCGAIVFQLQIKHICNMCLIFRPVLKNWCWGSAFCWIQILSNPLSKVIRIFFPPIHR